MPKQTECRRTSGSHFTQIKTHFFISSRFALEMYFFINHIAELFRLKTLAGNFDHERNLKYKRLPDSELLDLRSELYGSETHEYSFAHFRLPWKFLLPKCWVAIFKLRTKIICIFAPVEERFEWKSCDVINYEKAQKFSTPPQPLI